MPGPLVQRISLGLTGLKDRPGPPPISQTGNLRAKGYQPKATWLFSDKAWT